MKKNTYYLNILLLKLITEYNVKVRKDKEKMIIQHPNDVEWLQPNIIIRNIYTFEEVLEEYIKTTKQSTLISMIYNEKHDESYFLTSLIKNLTNSDYQDIETYVKRITSFLKDHSFSQYDTLTELGKLDEKTSIYVKRCQEYYGMETPYILKTYVKTKHLHYELPMIRYGVEEMNGKKTAYIFAIQRKKQYAPNKYIDEIEKSFRLVNSGVKYNRDISPSMLIVFSIFMGLAKSEGIDSIQFADFINSRYLHFRDIKDESDRDRIQTNATNKFLKIGLRASDQFDDVVITALPFTIDNFLHINLGNNITSKNCYLDNLYKISFQSNQGIQQEQPR